MTIQEMEYDLQFKLNRVDSNAFRGLLIPEMDWKINEAHAIYINNAIAAKRPNGLAFELNERITGDIAPLVTKQVIIPKGGVIPLPSDYRHFVKADATVSKGGCTLVNKVWIVQHEDLSELDHFSKPDFLWQEANAYFENQGLVIKADGQVDSVELTYVKKHPYVHNASGYDSQGYRLPSGELLTGTQNSLLPEHTHSEIVDIAVALITTELGGANTALLQQKLTINN